MNWKVFSYVRITPSLFTIFIWFINVPPFSYQNDINIMLMVVNWYESNRLVHDWFFKSLHCKKRHFVPNRYIYLNLSNVEATQDIYLIRIQFVLAKHNLLSLQIVVITLNEIICFKSGIPLVTPVQIDISIWYKVPFLQCRHQKVVKRNPIFLRV